MRVRPDATDTSTRSHSTYIDYATMQPPTSLPWYKRWFQSGAFAWCGCDSLLRLANTYYVRRVALVTLTSLFSMVLLCFDGWGELWFWLVFQSTNALLGLSALPNVALYSIIPRRDPTVDEKSGRARAFSFREVETRLEPFRLERSRILRICETIVVVQTILVGIVALFILVALFSYLQLVLIGEATLPTKISFDIHILFALFALICVFVQKNEFDRLRAHEQLQLGVGLDQDQLEYVHTMQKRPAQLSKRVSSVLSGKSTLSPHSSDLENTFYLSTFNIERSRKLSKRDLRRGLFEAAVDRDHKKARTLLDTMEQTVGSKVKLEKVLRKMYATPTLWLWSFAYATHNPLHVACRLGDSEMVEILLNGGMDPNLLDKTQGESFSLPLLYEICQGRRQNVRNVLNSPLHVAVAHGHTHVIDTLVRHPKTNIDIVAKSSFYSSSMRVSPVFLADSTDVLEFLIHHGVNFLIVPGKGNSMNVTVLQRTKQHERSELENVLMKWGADVALTPLHEVAGSGDIATVKRYLSLGVLPDQLGEFQDGVHRRTPLHWASIMGRSQVVRELLKYNANANADDSHQRTALHWAARHGHVETVRELLVAGADPLLCDDDGLSPLAFGAAGGRLNGACVELFVQYGVAINEQLENEYGDTCLHLALRGGHQKAALALIQHGADLASCNDVGELAIKCCTSAEQLYQIKVISKWIDIVISYDSSYRQLAERVQQGIEESYLTVFMRQVNDDAHESTIVMREASAVVCVLTPGFERNPFCMEELSYAKETHVPVMAMTIESMNLPEELQVYLFTRQLVPFGDAIIASRRTPGTMKEFQFQLDETKFKRSLQNLIDGLRDEVELRDAGGRSSGRENNGRSIQMSELRRTLSILGLGLTPQSSRGLNTRSKLATLSEVVTEATGLRRKQSARQGLSINALIRRPVFLSHGDCHKEFVAKLHKELKRNDIPVTLDSMTKVSSMKERILAAKDAILQCKIFLVVLSETSVKTELLSDQLAFAEDKGKHIVPIYFTHRPGLVDATVEQLLEANDRPMRIFGNDIGYGRGFDELLADLKREHALVQLQEDEIEEEWIPMPSSVRTAADQWLHHAQLKPHDRDSIFV